jgi:hypothetical protein
MYSIFCIYSIIYLLRKPSKKIKLVGNDTATLRYDTAYSHASIRLKFQISTCERAYSLRAVWPAEEVAV